MEQKFEIELGTETRKVMRRRILELILPTLVGGAFVLAGYFITHWQTSTALSRLEASVEELKETTKTVEELNRSLKQTNEELRKDNLDKGRQVTALASDLSRKFHIMDRVLNLPAAIEKDPDLKDPKKLVQYLTGAR